jgi:hypothetical protein
LALHKEGTTTNREYRKYEMAASLAEKYFDFEILIQLCDDTDNSERVERYLSQFSDKVILHYNCQKTVKGIVQ